MIRTILTVDNNNLTLSLPDEFVGKQIEIIAFVVEEAKEHIKLLKKKKNFSSIQLDTKGYKFNRNEANER